MYDFIDVTQNVLKPYLVMKISEKMWMSQIIVVKLIPQKLVPKM